MILKTNYIENKKEVYVTLISEGLPGVGWFCIFDAKDFYNRISVPASTIKGAVSAQCKRLAEYFHVEDNVLDYMFQQKLSLYHPLIILYFR